MTAVLVPTCVDAARQRVVYLSGRAGKPVPSNLQTMKRSELARVIEELEAMPRAHPVDCLDALACHSDTDLPVGISTWPRG